MQPKLRVLAPLLWLAFTVLLAFAFSRIVDLTPKIDETFFFASDDPHLKAQSKIEKTFSHSPFSILSVRGDIDSPVYQMRLKKLTSELGSLPETVSVLSLTKGPEDLKDAKESPLWQRLLISRDSQASFIFLTSENVPYQRIVAGIEQARARHHEPGFEITASGIPYISELISRNLFRDIKIFSLAAFVVFGLVLLLVFRSLWIVMGMFVACFNASAITLIITHFMRIPIGPLTANLSTIIFVCTLSPMVFLTFNWKKLAREGHSKKGRLAWDAVRMTFSPSFWSVATDTAGFASLLFVPSTPMRHLGIAGAIGTVAAMFAAYTIYPWFLDMTSGEREKKKADGTIAQSCRSFFSKRHGLIAAGILALGLLGWTGLKSVNPDPELLSYFKTGSEIREGLEYIDQNGGSNPLMMVISTPDKQPLVKEDQHKQLWTMHRALEEDPAVGHALSLPVFLGEAKRNWLSFLMSTDWLLKTLDDPKYGRITRHFLSPDKTKTLFLLRMKESGRKQKRQEIITRLQGIVRQHGFEAVLVGGTYSLQAGMADLLMKSTQEGSLLLIGVFCAMVFFLSRSLQVTGSLLLCLSVIPLLLLGLIGHARLPLDVITAPAVNLSLGIGVDAMIYLCVFARRAGVKNKNTKEVWQEICSWYWRPIATSMMVICAGYALFLLSQFPPTQRFGLFVIAGVVISDAVSLLLFPYLASFTFKREKILGPPGFEPGTKAL